jgi:hypothetical protein
VGFLIQNLDRFDWSGLEVTVNAHFPESRGFIYVGRCVILITWNNTRPAPPDTVTTAMGAEGYALLPFSHFVRAIDEVESYDPERYPPEQLLIEAMTPEGRRGLVYNWKD